MATLAALLQSAHGLVVEGEQDLYEHKEYLLIAGLEMHLFILVAMKPRACMYIDGTNVSSFSRTG